MKNQFTWLLEQHRKMLTVIKKENNERNFRHKTRGQAQYDFENKLESHYSISDNLELSIGGFLTTTNTNINNFNY